MLEKMLEISIYRFGIRYFYAIGIKIKIDNTDTNLGLYKDTFVHWIDLYFLLAFILDVGQQCQLSFLPSLSLSVNVKSTDLASILRIASGKDCYQTAKVKNVSVIFFCSVLHTFVKRYMN